MKKDELAAEIRRHLPQDSQYWKRNGSHYHGPRVYEPTSNSKALHVNFEDAVFYDHVDHYGSNFAGLAVKLKIPVNGGYSPVKTEIPANLREYELFRGLPENYLKDKNWQDGTFSNRKCIFIPTATIRQVRFLDANDPKYMWEQELPVGSDGQKDNPIYGLRRAIEIAKEQASEFLVQTNGAISVEVAQYHNIPAFAVLGGEGNFRKRHADTIMRHTDLAIVLILDRDKAGQGAAKAIAELYGERAIIVDLPGEYGTGFDLSDFCILYAQANPAKEIARMAKVAYNNRPPRTIAEAGQVVIARLKGEQVRAGRIIPMPFTSLHQFGGGAMAMLPGELSGIVALSSHGKTMFWQTLAEHLLKQTRRWGIMVDGREFKPDSDYIRHLIRETGVNHADIMRHEIAQQIALENGFIEDDERAMGVLLPDSELQKIIQHQQNEKYKFGYLEYADEYDFIEETLQYMHRRTLEVRENGLFMDLWIFDYLTLYRANQQTMSGAGEHVYNLILGEIKKWTRKANVHSIVLLQPNKEPSDAQMSKNYMLTQMDVAYASPNHFNFMISLNTLYGTKAYWFQGDNRADWVIKRDASTGEPIRDKAMLRDRTFAAIWKGLKNTNGEQYWSLSVRADYRHLRWLDLRWNENDLCVPLNAGL